MCVLDMGSLAEPFQKNRQGEWQEKPFVIWPPDGSGGWPCGFSYYEMPSPLGDLGAPMNTNTGQEKIGYPVSLQLGHYVLGAVTAASIHLYEVKKRGKGFERVKEVPLWVHTPLKALLARQEVRDTIFGIPRARLDKQTTYQVSVRVTLDQGAKLHEDGNAVTWTFTTGTKSR